MTALLRNQATMTRVGVIAPGSEGTATVVARLGDAERIRKARVHSIAILAARRTYAGRGARGRGEWNPVREVLDEASARHSRTSNRPASGCSSRSTCPARWSAVRSLQVSQRQRRDEAIKTISGLPFGDTDCALPILYAQEIDTFVIYTDSETWAGDIDYVVVTPAGLRARSRRTGRRDLTSQVLGAAPTAAAVAECSGAQHEDDEQDYEHGHLQALM